MREDLLNDSNFKKYLEEMINAKIVNIFYGVMTKEYSMVYENISTLERSYSGDIINDDKDYSVMIFRQEKMEKLYIDFINTNREQTIDDLLK